MPLLRKPTPVIPKRQYHVRILEPLAVKMERYAEFLGAANIDHVIAEALDFVFRKDTDFNAWLAEHPQTGTPDNLKSERKRTKPNGTGADLDVLKTDPAASGSTI
jgi:hypothetical protein